MPAYESGSNLTGNFGGNTTFLYLETCERLYLTNPSMSQTKSLLSRPLDLTYFIYVATHIPITIFLDCQSLYPLHMIPQPMKDFNAYYLREFKDPLVANARHMPWFKSFMWCEAIFQLPFFFWALRGLYNGRSGYILSLHSNL